MDLAYSEGRVLKGMVGVPGRGYTFKQGVWGDPVRINR